MRIELSFDEQLLRDYESRGRPLLFNIAWCNKGLYYPEMKWEDFGVVVLNWWLSVAVDLYRGANEAKLSFMDGPFAIGVKYDRRDGSVRLAPAGLPIVWPTTFSSFAETLIKAATLTGHELRRLGVGLDGAQDLDKAVENVRAELRGP